MKAIGIKMVDLQSMTANEAFVLQWAKYGLTFNE